MSDADRVLEALLHDVRSPLAAAIGYLRLIREKRIVPGPDLDHAIQQTDTALRSLSTLCARAEEWQSPMPPARESIEPLSRACDQIERSLVEHTIPVERDPMPASADLALTCAWTEVCPALVAMLAVVARPRPSAVPRSVRVRCTTTALELDVCESHPERSPNRSPFDPWVYPGLVVALGCRTIERCGGTWHADPDDAVLRVRLPLADPPTR